jgi:hypothetical protein
MSRSLSLELTGEAFMALRRRAEAIGTSPAKLAAETLEGQFAGARRLTDGAAQAARERFERHPGAAGPLDPSALNNDPIDADLAR